MVLELNGTSNMYIKECPSFNLAIYMISSLFIPLRGYMIERPFLSLCNRGVLPAWWLSSAPSRISLYIAKPTHNPE